MKYIVITVFIISTVYAQSHFLSQEELKNVKQVQVIVTQEYSNAEKVKFPFERDISLFLKAAKVTIVNSQPNANYSQFLIDVHGVPKFYRLRYQSTSNSGFSSYTDAEVNGSITFKINGTTYSKNFKGEIKATFNPDGSLAQAFNTSSDPNEAPFDKAFQESHYLDTLTLVVKEIFGLEPLITIFKKGNNVDENENYYEAVTRVLSKYGDSKVLNLFLSSAINTQNYIVRENLVNFGQLAIDALLQKLNNKNPSIRSDVMDILSAYFNLTNLAELDLLTPLLSDNYPSVRASTAAFFKKVKYDKVINPLAKLLNDKDSFVKNNAIEALSSYKDKNTYQLLIPMLKDQDISVRTCAVRELATNGDSTFVMPLISVAYNGEDYQTRDEAINSLGFHLLGKNDMRIINALVDIAINDKNEKYRYAARQTIWQHANDKEIFYIIEMLNRNDLDNSKMILIGNLLQYITNCSLGTDYVAWENYYRDKLLKKNK